MDSIERASEAYPQRIEFSVPKSQTACSSEPVQGRLSAIRKLKTAVAFLLDYREI